MRTVVYVTLRRNRRQDGLQTEMRMKTGSVMSIAGVLVRRSKSPTC